MSNRLAAEPTWSARWVAVFLAAALLFVGWPPFSSAHASTTLRVFGTVTCPTGMPVSGVYVHSSTGGSRHSDWRAHPGVNTAATYTATLTTTLPADVRVSVGCGRGDKPGTWKTTNRSSSRRVASGATSRAFNFACNGTGGCSWAPRSTAQPLSKSPNPVGEINFCQCTYFAAERWKALTGHYPNWRRQHEPGRVGHAKEWADNASRAGWRVSSRPHPRALFVNTSGTQGHVGEVTDVRVRDGILEIRINDQNHRGKARDWQRDCTKRTGHWMPHEASFRYILAPPQ
jgi:surface antigen